VEHLDAPRPDAKHVTISISKNISPEVEISYSLFEFGSHGESSALRAARWLVSNSITGYRTWPIG
jgi:hypothetical protein